jgi:DNA (cytosine-5)-methyltransferase 1
VKNGNGMGMPLSIAVQLLPTPQAHDSQGPKTPEQIATMRAKGFGVRNLNEAAVHELFPTPNASDASGGGQHPDKREGHSRQLIDYVLLCTPTAEPGTSRSGSRVDEPLLRKQAVEMSTAWGKYEPAIRRWEQLTRPAPPPTEPNKNGNPRLAAAFSEWLMGWPDGWVTDPAIGISRNDQLRIVGNGVCPQQAATALRYLLNVAEVSA